MIVRVLFTLVTTVAAYFFMSWMGLPLLLPAVVVGADRPLVCDPAAISERRPGMPRW